jgi:glucose/arabinose dehydrogenase
MHWKPPHLAAAIAASFVLSAAGCSASADASDPGTTEPPPATDTPTLTRTVVMSGLSNPWDVAVAPNGALFFTEKCRGLSVRQPDGTVVRLFGPSGSSLVASDLFCQGQSGMNGVALDPAFATNRRVYVFFASTLSGATRTNRVARLEVNAEYTVASNRSDIVTDIAYKNAGTANGGAGAHSGGRIRFGPDGFLYIGTGDNHDGPLPQHPTRLGGKVLRVTTTGAAAPGNNAPAGFDARIFTYGHRNVQGLAFQPGSGAVYTAEHGPNHSDEVTRLVAGGNAGWDPQNRPALSCPGGYCGYAGNPTSMPMTDVARFPSAILPAWNNDSESQGMGPAVFLDGANWRAWNGRLAVGIMGGQRLVILTIGANGTASAAVNAALPAVRYRGLTLGPDGALYVVTDAGEIWRVVPGPGA